MCLFLKINFHSEAMPSNRTVQVNDNDMNVLLNLKEKYKIEDRRTLEWFRLNTLEDDNDIISKPFDVLS